MSALICPYCYSDVSEEHNQCCGEAGHAVEKLKPHVYRVRHEDTTADEPRAGWYISPLFDGDLPRGGYSSREAAEDGIRRITEEA